MFNLINLFTSAAHSRPHLTHFISVRWKRRPKKPSWLGIAKTKLFKIPVMREFPELEKLELHRLRHNYERHMLSLKQFMVTDESSRVSTSTVEANVHDNMGKSKLLLDEWNAKSSILRKERLEREKIEQEEAAIKKIMEETERRNYIEAKVDKIVTAEIAASSSFVTKDNLDKVLDECFNNIQDYNYALDLKGNIYKGESTVPVGTLTQSNEHELVSDFKLSESKDHQSQEKNLT